MPTSDALVSTPKPVAVRAGRNHAAGRAVARRSSRRRCRCRAEPTRPHITQMLPDTPISSEPAAATAAPPAITTRGWKRGAAACRRGDDRARPVQAMIENRIARHHRARDRARRRPARRRAAAPARSCGPRTASPKMTTIMQDEVLEGEHVAERHALTRDAGRVRTAVRASRGRRTSGDTSTSADGVEHRCREKRAAQADKCAQARRR